MTSLDKPHEEDGIHSALSDALERLMNLQGKVVDLTHTVDTEKATASRFRINIIVLLVLSVLDLAGLGLIFGVAHEARNIAHRIDDCLIVGGECNTRMAKAGTSGLVRQMIYMECFSVVPSEKRDPALFKGCREKALAPIVDLDPSTPTTVTTTGGKK